MQHNRLALLQGTYYALTGLWPVVDIRTFQLVTGPKVDLWLVKTTGLLIAVIGGVLLLSGARKTENLETRLLGLGTAASFGSVDTIYATRGRISRIYLADALLQLIFALAWLTDPNRRLPSP